MKKYYLLTLSIIITLLFCSCENLVNKIENVSTKNVILTVTTRTNNSRIALPTIPAIEDMTFVATATKDGITVNGEKQENGTFAFELTEGNWNITISASVEEVIILQGTKTINIPASGKLQDEIQLDFFGDKGKINLSFTFDNSSVVKKIQIECDTAALKVAKTNVSGTSYNYTVNNIDPGTYNIQIIFFDENDKILTIIPEVIVVKNGMTTSKWTKNTNAPLITTDGKLEISNTLIDDYIKNTMYYIAGEGGSLTAHETIRNGSLNYPFTTLTEARNAGVDVDNAKLYISGNAYGNNKEDYKGDFQIYADKLSTTDITQPLNIEFKIYKNSDGITSEFTQSNFTNPTFNITMRKNNDNSIIANSTSLSLSIPANVLENDSEYTISLLANLDGKIIDKTYPFVVLTDYTVSNEESFSQLREWIQTGIDLEGVTVTLEHDVIIDNFTTLDTVLYDTYDSDNDAIYVKPFKGTFDGGGHKISMNVQKINYQFVSLFGRNDGIIKNVIVEKFSDSGEFGDDEQGGSRGAGICLYNNGIIQNCIVHANMTINTFHDVVGICFKNFEDGVIENCGFDGNLENNKQLPNWPMNVQPVTAFASHNYGTIINCVNSGTLKTSNPNYSGSIKNGLPGAIVSTMYANATIKNCYWLKDNVTYRTEKKNYLYFHKNDSSQTQTIEGCGYFISLDSSGDSQNVIGCADYYDNASQTQTLAYTDKPKVIDKLNAYVNDTANALKGLKQWDVNEVDGKYRLAFKD